MRERKWWEMRRVNGGGCERDRDGTRAARIWWSEKKRVPVVGCYLCMCVSEGYIYVGVCLWECNSMMHLYNICVWLGVHKY